MGDKRSVIETQVADGCSASRQLPLGVAIQGVAIQQAEPPSEVNDAFKEVTAAQQDAKSYINQANAYALQPPQKAQGEAAAFDKVYTQYKLAPEVTRRRMYYETMEQVLSKVDKTVIEAPGVTPYLPLPQVKKTAAAGRSGSNDQLRPPPPAGVRGHRGRSALLVLLSSFPIVPETKQAVDRPLWQARADPQPLRAGPADRRRRSRPRVPLPFVDQIVWIDKRVHRWTWSR